MEEHDYSFEKQFLEEVKNGSATKNPVATVSEKTANSNTKIAEANRPQIAHNTKTHLGPKKDHVKLLLAITTLIMSVIVVVESFVMAVIISNYFGVFESSDESDYSEDYNDDDNPEGY